MPDEVLNSTLKQIISYDQEANWNLLSDAECEQASSFYAILDRTGRLCDEDTFILNVPIPVFITGDLPLL
jgi:hypothetical protein